MIVTRLRLVNVRAIEAAEFTFKPGMNLLVGINGAGKTTVLDALRTSMSALIPIITPSRTRPFPFLLQDIRADFPFLDVTITVSLGGEEIDHTSRKWREQVARDDEENVARLRREILESDRLRERARNLLRDLETPQAVEDSSTFSRSATEMQRLADRESNRPNCIHFAPTRSVIDKTSPTRAEAAGTVVAAYAGALAPRSWQLRPLAAWMRAQVALSSESPRPEKHLEALRQAAERFLPSYRNLRPSEDGSTLLLDHEGTTLEVNQLSDGERGVLGMVLDLARRLSQASRGAGDPLVNGSAVVLIDEIDLHLHPSWQREIVRRLVDVFPNCQFIATSHSPQVIGEVEHERIQIIADGEVYSPTHSFGVDSSRILEEIMDTAPRTKEVQTLLDEFSNHVESGVLEDAQQLVESLVKRLGESDPEVTRARTLLDFLRDDS